MLDNPRLGSFESLDLDLIRAHSRTHGVAIRRRRATVGPVMVRTTARNAKGMPPHHAVSDAGVRVLWWRRHNLSVGAAHAIPKNKAGS